MKILTVSIFLLEKCCFGQTFNETIPSADVNGSRQVWQKSILQIYESVSISRNREEETIVPVSVSSEFSGKKTTPLTIALGTMADSTD